MRVLTTTLCYPTPNSPDMGVFVQRRTAAVHQHARVEVDVLVPRPWCPLLRPAIKGSEAFSGTEAQSQPLTVRYSRMVSVPVVGWLTDGLAFSWAVERHIVASRASGSPAYDLIDAHFEYPDGVGAWLAGRRLGLPVVVTVRGKIVSLSRRALRRMQIAAMLRGVAARIAVSESLAGWVRRVAGGDLTVDVVPNGVDSQVFHPVDRDYARQQLRWVPDARYILAVGHLQHVKGFDRLVSIVPALRRRIGDVRLVLVGSHRGEVLFRRRLTASIARVNRSEGRDEPCVRFTGPVSAGALNLMYNAADVLASASRSEGWSNAISEALAAGTPVVATDVGGNGEQICAPCLGRLVSDGDAGALTDAIAECCVQSWNRPAIAAHGRARDWASVAHQVRAVFARVLGQSVPCGVASPLAFGGAALAEGGV